jgi:Spy/CpxP family protein refolding chaperone
MAKQRELNELRGKMQVKATDFRLDIRKALTPEQAAQLGTLGAEMGFHRGMGRRQGPCDGPGQGPCPGCAGFGPGGNRL